MRVEEDLENRKGTAGVTDTGDLLDDSESKFDRSGGG